MVPDSEQPVEFFIDRSLGKSIAEGLRELGLTVHTMASVYGEEQAQRLADEVWLAEVGARGGLSSPRTMRSDGDPPSATR